ncbi:MAG TPA: DUF4911 domain-containing protein [Desulfovibrio sp.]|jgi:hypothetical protein|uniref:DUF4911 domain-containing protein n=1 Tax=Desulfovibrio TaxID=872 RepID=UPI002A440BA6|nr:DUF4911 domain-containing protein [Desulfovibrio sp.]MDY0305142.1 DUF4911 domain-containing protein [Desulfovibrionaceae bacterium]HMM39460.1 DUF4911 domain-containing protein [Desulfovibrio sp.]
MRRGRRKIAGPPPKWSSRLYVRLEPSRIALFRFLLEAHDNLALFSVADRRKGILQLNFSPDQDGEVRAFLARVQAETGVETVLDPGKG